MGGRTFGERRRNVYARLGPPRAQCPCAPCGRSRDAHRRSTDVACENGPLRNAASSSPDSDCCEISPCGAHRASPRAHSTGPNFNRTSVPRQTLNIARPAARGSTSVADATAPRLAHASLLEQPFRSPDRLRRLSLNWGFHMDPIEGIHCACKIFVAQSVRIVSAILIEAKS